MRSYFKFEPVVKVEMLIKEKFLGWQKMCNV